MTEITQAKLNILLIGKLEGLLSDDNSAVDVDRNFHTQVTPSIESALSIIEPDTFDLILCDVASARPTEAIAVQNLAKNVPHTPTIFLTEPAHAGIFDEIPLSDIQEYFPKSVLVPDMLPTIVAHASTRFRRIQVMQDKIERYRSFFQSFTDAIFSTNKQGMLIDYNQSAVNLLGYDSAELMGTLVQTFIPDANNFESLVSQLDDEGLAQDFPLELRNKSGETRSCLITLMAQYDKKRNVIGYQGIVRDITHRQSLEEMWRRYEFIVNTSKEFMTLVSRDYVYHAANESYCRAHDKKQAEIIGRSVSQVWGEGRYLEKIKENFDRCFAGNEIQYQGWFSFSALGRRYMDVTYYPYRTEDGITTHAVVVSRDITERTRAEKALRHAHAQNQQLLASIPSILISVSPEDNIIHWNKPAEVAFGIATEAVIGQAFLECGIQWDWMEILRRVNESRNNSTPSVINNVKYILADGTEGYLNLTVSPFEEEEKGELPGYLLIGQDVTQQKHLEMQLRQAQKLESIGQLAAGIAHEINTPTQYVGDNIRFMQDSFTDIAGLLGQYQELLEKVKASGDFANLVTDIESTVDDADIDFVMDEVPSAIDQSLEGVARVSDIVRAMKEFSHPGVEEKTTININKALESTLTVARNEWKYVADARTLFSNDVPMVPCFAGELNQVFLNIIVNAAHAIEDVVKNKGGEKGVITLETKRDGDFVEIRIGDTGMGIPESVQSKIFDPFFTTKDVGRGTGQGLAISHAVIVEKHKGNITFETEMGKGTTFIIRLPLATVPVNGNGII